MFNISDYENLILKLLNAGLKPTTNWNEKMTVNSLLLRHDIDFSPDYALKIAKIESKLNVQATYFIMLTSNMYNFLSSHNQKLVKDIIDLGHKVSLHFDPKAYENVDKFLEEKNIFENITNNYVDIVSVHRPGLLLKNNNVSLSGVKHTYQDSYFKKMKYISDSGCKNIFPQLSEYLKNSRKFGLHLLIHPIWWASEGSNPTEKLNQWRKIKHNFLKLEIKKNCKIYDEK